MSIASQITRIRSNIAAAYTTCEAKGAALPLSQNSANLSDAISSIRSSEDISWHQCPESVRNYLAYAAQHPYDPTDYSETYINDPDHGAPNYQNIPDEVSVANSKPIGKTVDGVTFYDNEPNVATPFSTSNKAGTLTALDRLRWYNTTIGAALEGSNYKRGMNCRDLGGWSCDGGTVRYGVLVRGGEPNPSDKALMVDKIGIKTEVQLLPVSEQATAYKKCSVWGIEWKGNDTQSTSVYSVADSPDLWKKILSAIFDSVIHDKPVMFHCGVGADRTGIVAIVLEGILGVSRSDIDQDFELTDFALGWHADPANNNLPYRSRKHPTYKPVMDGINAVPLVGGLSDTFRNRCISFVLSLGFTVSEVNAFRAACISGTPDTISVSLNQYSVSKSGINVTFSNTSSAVDQFQGYETELTPAAGYVIDSVSVTMGGVDISNSVFEGEIAEPTGTIQINANGRTDVSFYKSASVNVSPNVTTKSISANGTYNASSDSVDGYSQVTVNVPTVSPSGTKQITNTSLTDVTNYANAQVVDANLVAGNIKKDISILGIIGTYEAGGGSAANCKKFTFSSASAVANQEVTVVSGDSDVAAHYADANATVTVIKATNNSTRGLAFLMDSNHGFDSDSTIYGVYLNYSGSGNNAGTIDVSLSSTETSDKVRVKATSNGDIIVRCRSTTNNFGGASYIITFTW